jgi:hypothetical protein
MCWTIPIGLTSDHPTVSWTKQDRVLPILSEFIKNCLTVKQMFRKPSSVTKKWQDMIWHEKDNIFFRSLRKRPLLLRSFDSKGYTWLLRTVHELGKTSSLKFWNRTWTSWGKGRSQLSTIRHKNSTAKLHSAPLETTSHSKNMSATQCWIARKLRHTANKIACPQLLGSGQRNCCALGLKASWLWSHSAFSGSSSLAGSRGHIVRTLASNSHIKLENQT